MDQGIRQTYATRIRDALDKLNEQLARNLNQQQVSQMERQATAGILEADIQTLRDLHILRGRPIADLQAEEASIRAGLRAVQQLVQTVKSL